MKIINLLTGKEASHCGYKTAVALGNFDGVHTGHAALFKLAKQHADICGLHAAAWTFSDPFFKNRENCITTLEQRLSLIKELGVHYAFVYDFDEVKDFSCEKFVSEILIKKCRAEAAFCGYNFRFGKGASGDFSTLQALMNENGKQAYMLDAYSVGGQTVSSSLIREKIKSGDMIAASRLLGRPFAIQLPVVYGKQLGRTLGAPTINQNFHHGQIIPKRGVYACIAVIGRSRYKAVANVGIRPSVEGSFVNCETHIIGYGGDLYGKNIKVEFCKYIREEKKFSSLEELKQAISGDILHTEEFFKNEYGKSGEYNV